MKHLILVRHGHAEQSHGDHGRPLSARGEQAATDAGKYLAQAGPLPQIALLSSALRVKQTWAKIGAELSHSPRVEIERSLYLSDVDAMNAQILAVPESTDCAVLVAHNPGITDLAIWLTATGVGELVERLGQGFAPAAVAFLALDIAEWADTRSRCAEIQSFWEP